MKEHSYKIYLILFFWLVINLLTAAFTELSADEAYYWVYGFRLDWGYFDHPPMIALFNSFLDRNVLHTELSVRFLTVLSSAGYVWVLYKFIQPKDLLLFCSIVFSSLAVNIFGFVSVPDAPLILLSGLFYWVYQRYFEKEDWQSIVALSIIIPLLFYTKYHALLIIVFSVIASPQVLKRKSFYLIFVASLVVYLPHIYWQVVHDYPSVKYHFFERNSTEYHVEYTIDYFIGQFTFYGFFTVLASIAYWFQKEKTFTHRLLIVNYIGFFLFFALSSAKSWVEVNWTVPSITAISYLSYSYLSINGLRIRKAFIGLQLFTILLFCILRIHLISPFYTPFHELDRTRDFHNNKALEEAVMDSVKENKVYATRYQEASILSYYSNSFIPSINLNGRKNLFNSWDVMPEINNTKGFLFMDFDGKNLFVSPSGKKYSLFYKDSLSAFQGVEILNLEYKNESFQIYFDTLWLEKMNDLDFNSFSAITLKVTNKDIESEFYVMSVQELSLIDDKNGMHVFPIVLKKGANKIEISLKTYNFGVWSKKYFKQIEVD